jgi:hypothetical protein
MAVDDDQPVFNVCLSAHGTPKQQLWKHAVLLQQKRHDQDGLPMVGTQCLQASVLGPYSVCDVQYIDQFAVGVAKR